MHIYVFLVTACALVYSVLAGSSSLANSDQRCVAPNNKRTPDCNQIRLRYFYNKTTGRCQNFRWTGCDRNGAFDSLYSCVSTCNKGQGAPFCANPPPGPCEGKDTDKPRERFFYNITAQRCQSYKFCGEKQKLLDNNYFIAETYCLKQCGGFDESTAMVKNEPKAID
uniref:BPTI/Kunitz inhibitor domain-containing protein n=1 Tax=Amblyomma maculatum TaxID=34609 RepID=G3MT81_AMBMU